TAEARTRSRSPPPPRRRSRRPRARAARPGAAAIPGAADSRSNDTPGRGLPRSRLPAEVARRDEEPGDPPGGNGGDRAALGPDLLVVEVDRVDDVEEVRERQHIGDPLEHREVVARGAVGAGQD